MNDPKWFAVVGFGCSGPGRRTPEEAWAAFDRAACRRIRQPYEPSMAAMHRARFHARLVAGTTRRAVEAADIALNDGYAGRGEWWST